MVVFAQVGATLLGGNLGGTSRPPCLFSSPTSRFPLTLFGGGSGPRGATDRTHDPLVSGHEQQQTRASSSSPACRAISGPASDLHQTHLEREAPPV